MDDYHEFARRQANRFQVERESAEEFERLYQPPQERTTEVRNGPMTMRLTDAQLAGCVEYLERQPFTQTQIGVLAETISMIREEMHEHVYSELCDLRASIEKKLVGMLDQEREKNVDTRRELEVLKVITNSKNIAETMVRKGKVRVT